MDRVRLLIKWTINRNNGYNVCTLYANGEKVGRCDGGGYDMIGTCWAEYLEKYFAGEIYERVTKEFYGLKFYDKTCRDSETPVPAELAYSSHKSERHTVPVLDGACGIDCMLRIVDHIGGKLSDHRRLPNDGESWDFEPPPPASEENNARASRRRRRSHIKRNG